MVYTTILNSNTTRASGLKIAKYSSMQLIFYR